MDKLLHEIAQDLNILQGNSEPEESYKSRIVYSAVGHMSLASLYDIDEYEETISVQGLRGHICITSTRTEIINFWECRYLHGSLTAESIVCCRTAS